MGIISKWLYHKRGEPEYCHRCGGKLICEIRNIKFDKFSGNPTVSKTMIYCRDRWCSIGLASDFPLRYVWTEKVEVCNE